MLQPPTGTITFLFTDIEGSTKLWEQYPDAMRPALSRHDQILRQTITENGGLVFKTVGDAFCAAFSNAPDAVAAVIQAHRVLSAQVWEGIGPLRIRVGIHTGEAEARGGDYFGPALNRVARLQGIGHGGQTLLSQTSSALVRDALPEGAWLQDLGSHRLKDLGQPEHVWQLCLPDQGNEFPRVRSLQALANNLPLQTTSFVGRGPEIAEGKGLLASHRLVTMTGTGGGGKTRLALQLAADQVEQYGDGVWLVELAAIPDPGLVPQALASALGVREEHGRSLTQTLADYLMSKTALILLDNCEHLIDSCASLVHTLLKACAGVKVLATSREALGVPGEQPWRIPSLSLPDPNTLPLEEKEIGAILLGYDSVRLFVDRARVHRGDFVLSRANAVAVTQVCQRLDGIPLAIELAATRVRVLPVEQIRARLDDRFRLLKGGARTALPRQQTLRALIDWSYDLLTEQEKAVLCRLSVFAGGWTLSAAEAICSTGEGADGGSVEDSEVLDLLTSLVDKSLVVYEETEGDEGRYRLLETIRQYGTDRLTDAGAAETLQRRHLDWCVSLALEARPHLTGPEAEEWLGRLDNEHDNMRAALSWNLSEPDDQRPLIAEGGLRLAAGLWRFWYIRGHLSEGRSHLETALARGSEPTTARAGALSALAILTQAQGGYGAARAYLEQALAIFRSTGDRVREAGILGNLGNIAEQMGDHGLAHSCLEQALSLCRALGDRLGEACHLNNLGSMAQLRGEFGASRVYYETSMAVYQEVGDQGAATATLASLGLLSAMEGDYKTARASLEQALATSRGLMGRMAEASFLANLGMVAEAQGDYRASRSYLVSATKAYRELQGRLGLVETLEHFGVLLARHGDWMGAAWLFGNTETVREELSTPLPSVSRERQDVRTAQVRSALGDDAFATAWDVGRAMTLEQAVEYALAENHDGSGPE